MARRWVGPSMVRWLSGLLVSVAMVAAVSGVIALLEPRIPVLSLLVLYMLVVLPVAILWGTGLAAVASVLSATAFSYLFLSPTRNLWIADPRDAAAMGVFLVTAVVVGTLTARARRTAAESTRLSEQQSALRRVATLVAQSGPPSAAFEAVTREVGQLCRADLARMERYEEDGTVTGVAAWSRVPVRLAVGARFNLDGASIAREVRRTGAPARVDSFGGQDTGAIASEARELGIRSSVGCPIVVAGRLWGVIAASKSSDDPFPPDTESQIGRFTELVATAIANAEARFELRRIADEQAALRRVATLVAEGVSPDVVFAAVAEEVATVTGAQFSVIARFEPDGTGTMIGGRGWSGPDLRGTPWRPEPRAAAAGVRATGRAARFDEDATSDATPDVPREAGIRSEVGCSDPRRGSAVGRDRGPVGNRSAPAGDRGAVGRLHRAGGHRDRERGQPGAARGVARPHRGRR